MQFNSNDRPQAPNDERKLKKVKKLFLENMFRQATIKRLRNNGCIIMHHISPKHRFLKTYEFRVIELGLSS